MLLPTCWGAIFYINSLSGIKHLWEDIRFVSLECYGFSKSSSNDFAVELVFHSIIEENGASLNLKQITEHFDQSWQVELNVIIKANISCDVEKSNGVL